MNKYKVGIIGYGFVGEAIAFAFSPVSDIFIYDIDKNKRNCNIDEIFKCDFVFVCVPTPMDNEGKQDLSIIEQVFEFVKPGPIYIIKSTVLPKTTMLLSEKYPELSIIFSPEFLTERTSKLDMLTQARIILGGNETLTKEVEKLFNVRFKQRNIIHTDSTTAEFVKYMNNTYFACKISLMNEFYLLSKKLDVNWNDALFGFVSDGRIADSHLDVPGPDGKLGFGGTCFPKDINAIINLGDELGIDMNVLKGAWKTNLNVRPEQDWKNLKGRAIN